VLFRFAVSFIVAFTSRRWRGRPGALLWGCACALALSACGGGGGTTPDQTSGSPLQAQSTPTPLSEAEAHRFVHQASFGPTPALVGRIRQIGAPAWIDEQLALAPLYSHEALVRTQAEELNVGPATYASLTAAWWTNALTDAAQLKLRVAFALSQIMVVSSVTVDTTSTASYLDVLVDKGTGRYRDLIEAVALHPAMGEYLSHMANRKEDPTIGRVPDENFARELMQLFSIGLYQLDDAALPMLVDGAPIEAFGSDDVSGLAKVFTGWSWHRPVENTTAAWWECFWRARPCADERQFVLPMGPYDNEHADSVKRFLGITIPAQAQASARTSLRLALDRLAQHPNTAPFISRQLIQKLVTSNPSSAYVRDVVRTWRATDGHLGAVVKAILLHEEARRPSDALGSLDAYGKVREPVLRLSHLLRAFAARSQTYTERQASGTRPFVGGVDTADTATTLGQTPMRAASVFNFFRPGHVPARGGLAAAGLVAPEMQLANETTTLSYANFMAEVLQRGWGTWVPATRTLDLQFDWSTWTPLASQPEALMDALSLRLLGHGVRPALRTHILNGLAGMPTATSAQRLACVRAVVLMLLVDTDFIVQQ
jgi:uncharacterized protein (DUF1800 family)